MRENGKFGFIIPSAWLGGPRYAELRSSLLATTIDSIILLPFDVFSEAYIDTALLTTTKNKPRTTHQVITYEYPKRERIKAIVTTDLKSHKLLQTAWAETEDQKFVLDAETLSVISSIRKKLKTTLQDVIQIKRGVLFDISLLTKTKTSKSSHKYFKGNIYRYKTEMITSGWVEYGTKMKEFPKEFKWFHGDRILLRRLVNRQRRLMASTISDTVITNKNLYSILNTGNIALEYVLGILNSKLISRIYLSLVSQATKDDFPQVTIRDLNTLPFRKIDFSDNEDKKRHDRMVSLVQTMLNLNKQLAGAKTSHEKTALRRQIDATDRQIDNLVYKLYDLTEKEIAIVEKRRCDTSHPTVDRRRNRNC